MKKSVTKPFSISLKIGTDTYASKGQSMQEALAELPRPVKLFQKGVLTISDGVRTKQIPMPPAKMKRLWMKYAPMYYSRNLIFMLK